MHAASRLCVFSGLAVLPDAVGKVVSKRTGSPSLAILPRDWLSHPGRLGLGENPRPGLPVLSPYVCRQRGGQWAADQRAPWQPNSAAS